MSTLEDRRVRQERERALIAEFAPDAAAAIAAEQRCRGVDISDRMRNLAESVLNKRRNAAA